MYVIRQAVTDDVPALLKMARMVQSNNLPADPDRMRTKIGALRRNFAGDFHDTAAHDFIFVLENTDTGHVIGTSSILTSLGGPAQPHLYLSVNKREHYSTDLKSGQVHVTLQLQADESGATEIGGLVLSPAYRGHPERLGSYLSLIRFHFMGLHRAWFADRVIAEMMGAVTAEQRNALWEHLGRRFINLSYVEADRFSRESKEFITSLFPSGEIYLSLLPPEVRNLIGSVGPEAEPARRMLQRLGFVDLGHVDPFDGGPYLEAMLEDIAIVTGTRPATLGDPAPSYPQRGFVSIAGAGGFRAVRTELAVTGEVVSIPAESAGLLGAQVGDAVAFTAFTTAPAERRSNPAQAGA